jgi:hypothetical protein
MNKASIYFFNTMDLIVRVIPVTNKAMYVTQNNITKNANSMISPPINPENRS